MSLARSLPLTGVEDVPQPGHQRVDGLGEVPVADDEAAVPVRGPQGQVRVGDLDLDSRAARLAPGQAGQQGGAGGGPLRRGSSLVVCQGRDRFGVRRAGRRRRSRTGLPA